MSETSTKPYLIRALHEWCTDNGYTPYLTVTVDARTVVPREHVKDGEIVLNVGALATHKLELGNDFIEFQARFGGVARQISVPVDAVTAIYARETGQGMAFEAVSAATTGDDAPDAPPALPTQDAPAEPAGAAGGRPALSAVPDAQGDQPPAEGGEPPQDPPPAPPRGRPSLKVIK